jgi:hypothetical protein
MTTAGGGISDHVLSDRWRQADFDAGAKPGGLAPQTSTHCEGCVLIRSDLLIQHNCHMPPYGCPG